MICQAPISLLGVFLTPLNNYVSLIKLPFGVAVHKSSFVLFRTKSCCNKSKYSDVEFLSSEMFKTTTP